MSSTSQRLDKVSFQTHIQTLWDPTLISIRQVLKKYIYFTLAFICMIFVECLSFFIFFPYFYASTFLAFIFSFIFLSFFSYFILRLYIQTKKPEHLLEICEEYLSQCKEGLHFQQQIPKHHLALATAAQKLSSVLNEQEYYFFPVAGYLKSLEPTFKKFSCFCFWEDFFLMKEYLLSFAVEQHLEIVKCEPTNLEVHAALANAYVILSSLYADPKKELEYDEEKWIHPGRFHDSMRQKFRKTASKAIEEFKILNHYAPNDPWVHTQLAYSYHDLQMPEEEIKEYEHILQLKPHDVETLFKLGMLYFQQGHNARGLKMYEQLKKWNYRKAENLINFYGESFWEDSLSE